MVISTRPYFSAFWEIKKKKGQIRDSKNPKLWVNVDVKKQQFYAIFSNLPLLQMTLLFSQAPQQQNPTRLLHIQMAIKILSLKYT